MRERNLSPRAAALDQARGLKRDQDLLQDAVQNAVLHPVQGLVQGRLRARHPRAGLGEGAVGQPVVDDHFPSRQAAEIDQSRVVRSEDRAATRMSPGLRIGASRVTESWLRP